MINLSFEKTSALDAQERYDIISMAMDAADDNGFVNSFIFERALYCFAAIIFYPDRKEELAALASVNPLDSWMKLVEDGTIQKMKEEYPEELNALVEESAIWYEEYADYAHSARGILEMVQSFTGNLTQNAAQLLTKTAEDTGVHELLDTADKWGMNRRALAPQVETHPNIIDAESLFKNE